MKHLILSLLVTITVIFHNAVRKPLKRGKVREVFCARWCVDAVFAVCGTIISFGLYNYEFLPFLTVRNALLWLLYLIITFLFVLLAPSGLSLVTKRKTASEEEFLLAEYRFNDTLCMVRDFFLALLFGIPILLALLEKSHLQLPFLQAWNETELCGGLCFTSFLLLLPLSLRQTFFWLRNLSGVLTETEASILQQYRMKLHYTHKNRRL